MNLNEDNGKVNIMILAKSNYIHSNELIDFIRADDRFFLVHSRISKQKLWIIDDEKYREFLKAMNFLSQLLAHFKTHSIENLKKELKAYIGGGL